MKRIVIALLIAIAGNAAYAQSNSSMANETQAPAVKTLEQRADEITASMAKNLRLTPDQTAKLKLINLTSMQHAEDAKLKYKEDPRMIVKQMDIISQTRLSQIKDILSPYQFQQYQDRREEKMGVPNEAKSNPTSRQMNNY